MIFVLGEKSVRRLVTVEKSRFPEVQIMCILNELFEQSLRLTVLGEVLKTK